MPLVKLNEPYLLIDNVRFENTIPDDISYHIKHLKINQCIQIIL